jgi:hypothetical protein
MQRLGIPDPASDQGQALAALIRKGWQPENITPQAIETTLKNRGGKQ